MKNVKVEMMLFISLIFFTVMIIACRKHDTAPTPEPIVNNPSPVRGPSIAPFSGKWTGTINVDAIYLYLCTYTGSPITLKQDWLVSPDSTVTIVDSAFDYNSTVPWTQTWKGKIYNQDSLSITLTKDNSCFGVTHTMKTELKTKIVKTPDNKYTITAKVHYPMCPPDCQFTFNYLVEKQD